MYVRTAPRFEQSLPPRHETRISEHPQREEDEGPEKDGKLAESETDYKHDVIYGFTVRNVRTYVPTVNTPMGPTPIELLQSRGVKEPLEEGGGGLLEYLQYYVFDNA